ncbi:hypothetical protein DCS_08095 [Drechmeria coniospora]|uniref:Uncharacterized protein n=1 Tax=Drechmeria coniospora TaxID=98403 RepID=A0A151GGA2_DRECN|nr:hypothetical protein DCS_08095 [Drechmeria coniospora]KYK56128.1 hypothetical protein DCS_08095 [Drechmeria coniospora]
MPWRATIRSESGREARAVAISRPGRNMVPVQPKGPVPGPGRCWLLAAGCRLLAQLSHPSGSILASSNGQGRHELAPPDWELARPSTASLARTGLGEAFPRQQFDRVPSISFLCSASETRSAAG